MAVIEDLYADLAVGDVKESDGPMGHSPARCQMPDLYKGPLVTPRFTNPKMATAEFAETPSILRPSTQPDP